MQAQVQQQANVRTYHVEGGELVINNTNPFTSYWFNTYRLSAREFARVATLKGVRF